MGIKDCLYNMDRVKGDTCFLTEGPFDAMRFPSYGIALFSKMVSQRQVKVLMERFKRVFIFFDDEKDAQKDARKLVMNLQALDIQAENSNICKTFSCKDPGSLSDEDAREIERELLA
jgi:hypothetical protein